jgi:three-Cys-motif partner protein
MTTPEETTWDIEPHTAVKHRILQHYLNAWFPILNRYHRRVIYLDGFSGPGVYKGGQPGSPIIALKTASEHFRPIDGEAVFLFVEDRPDRVTNLRVEVSKLTLPKNYKVHIESGQFEAIVSKILDDLEKGGKSLAPTFAFVDPFGFSGLPFKLMERLLRHDRSEAFITFMVDSINRFASTPNNEIRRHIRDLFGTDEVFEIVTRSGDRGRELTQLYQRQLATVGRYVRSFEMRDRNDKIIYHLQFVTKHPLGHRKMKEAMWKVDSEGDFRFSDATDPSQQILFRADHAKRLFEILTRSFNGQTVDVSLVRKFVQDQTGYVDKHATQSLTYGEQNSKLLVNDIKADGKNRKKNTFPPGTIVTFAA